MYLEIDEGFITHRKTLRFCGMMQDQNAFAYLMRLWSWATRSAPDGRMAGMDPTDIEIAVQYRLMDGRCYRAMVAAGFIDTDADGNPVMIHNWPTRTGGAIARMEVAAKASRTRKERWRERQRNADGTPVERDGDATGTASERTQSSQAKASQEERAPARLRDPWPARRWYEKFKIAWVPVHGRVAYGDGDRLEGVGGSGLLDGKRTPPRDDADRCHRAHRFPPGPAAISGWDGPQPAIRRGDDGVPGRSHRLRLLGNSVVQQQAALAWRTLTARPINARRAA